MYPGGGGARIEQYLKIPNFTNVKRRTEVRTMPYYFEDKFSGFIPDTSDSLYPGPPAQGGFKYPIVSYYKRNDCNERKYWWRLLSTNS